MAIRRWAVMCITAVCLAGDGARTIVSAQVAQGDGSAQAAQGDGTTPQDPVKPETIPEPEHTGCGSLFHSTISDFAAFPQRKSTWVILGIGAGAAAIAYPFDDEINESLQDADGLGKFLQAGQVPRVRVGPGRRCGRSLRRRALFHGAGRPAHTPTRCRISASICFAPTS